MPTVSHWLHTLDHWCHRATRVMTLAHYEQLIRNWEYQAKMVDATNERQVAGWRLYLQYLKAKGEQQGEEFVAIYNAFERRIALNSSAFIND